MRKNLFVEDGLAGPDREILLAVILTRLGEQALRVLKHRLERLAAPTDDLDP